MTFPSFHLRHGVGACIRCVEMGKSDSLVASGVDAARARRPAILDRFARGAVLSRLAGIKNGRVVIEDGDERIACGQDLADADVG